ncbi:Bark storage protein like [Actinidia chinensis var. chinensis]|uniref:Bark storage protein like n=1 Tax=Actinidia chinensis var. chinensis TaxID=1590841 RepID=A0A2R6PIU5_ACTCC|nr:Bark storage protein like [Actinidia chinensis var. chinensis]
MTLSLQEANGAFHSKTQELISRANMNGPYLGLVIPNLFEMNPLLQSPSFKPSDLIIDFQGRRFRFGTIGNKQVILVMTGLGMINAGVTTQLLLSLFEVEGVVHYGIAGNANPSLHIGDVTIPQYWAHTALWSWQRNGDGPEDPLPLEENGDYTREIGYIKFANYATNITNCPSNDNLLNNVWYQPEEVFFRDGVPEEREHAFWVPVDTYYFQLAKKLEGMELEGCVNSTTCLTEKPKVTRVHRGISASIYLDNAAYRAFIFGKFNVSPVDMESAAVALICLQQRTPFIIFRALSDLAGGGSADSNEAATFISLAANNSVAVVLEFIKNLPTKQISIA